MIELLKTLVEPLVENKDAIDIREIERDNTIVLELRVADEDMGRVIGRGGRRAQAMRSIMKAKAKMQGMHCIVDIVD